jgi:hypothetical protein
MAANDKEELKQLVIEYLQNKPSYNPNENLTVMCDNGNVYFILYGEDLQSGVAGFGKTTEKAFEDFKCNWDKYKSNAGVKISANQAFE